MDASVQDAISCDAFLNCFSFVPLQKRKCRLAEFRKGGSDTFYDYFAECERGVK